LTPAWPRPGQSAPTPTPPCNRSAGGISGRLGKGGCAAAEGANAVRRIKALPTDTVVEPRVLGGFHLLFDKPDRRIADVIEDGIDRCALLERVTLPRVVEGSSSLPAPTPERFMPVNRGANPELMDTIRRRLRPRQERTVPTPGPTRAELHAALIHRPEPQASGPEL